MNEKKTKEILTAAMGNEGDMIYCFEVNAYSGEIPQGNEAKRTELIRLALACLDEPCQRYADIEDMPDEDNIVELAAILRDYADTNDLIPKPMLLLVAKKLWSNCSSCEHNLYCTHEYKETNNTDGKCSRYKYQQPKPEPNCDVCKFRRCTWGIKDKTPCSAFLPEPPSSGQASGEFVKELRKAAEQNYFARDRLNRAAAYIKQLEVEICRLIERIKKLGAEKAKAELLNTFYIEGLEKSGEEIEQLRLLGTKLLMAFPEDIPEGQEEVRFDIPAYIVEEFRRAIRKL